MNVRSVFFTCSVFMLTGAFSLEFKCPAGFVSWIDNNEHVHFNSRMNETCTCDVGTFMFGDRCVNCPVGKFKNTVLPGDVCQECGGTSVNVNAEGASTCQETCPPLHYKDSKLSCRVCPLNVDILLEKYESNEISVNPQAPVTEKTSIFTTSLANLNNIFSVKCPESGSFVDDFLELRIVCGAGTEKKYQNGVDVCTKCVSGMYRDSTDTTRVCNPRAICSGDEYENTIGVRPEENNAVCSQDPYTHTPWYYPVLLQDTPVYVGTHRTVEFSGRVYCIEYVASLENSPTVVDMMDSLWLSGTVSFQNTNAPVPCFFGCIAGYEWDQSKKECTACAEGMYKSTVGTSLCVSCDAKHFQNADKSGCVVCQEGDYFNKNVHQCQECCVINREYESTHACYDLVNTHYITDSCTGGSDGLNIQSCPRSIPSSRTMWKTYGVNHCQLQACYGSTYYNTESNACEECPISYETLDRAGICRPSCAKNRYLQMFPNPDATQPFSLYECTTCSSTLASLRQLCPDDTLEMSFFLDTGTCSKFSDTQCSACIDIKPPYQTLIAPDEKTGNWSRCQFQCLESDVNKKTHYVTFDDALTILHTEEAVLLNALQNFTENGIFKGCIRSSVLYWDECDYSFPHLITSLPTTDTEYGWVHDETIKYETWPAIVCSPVDTYECVRKGGAYYKQILDSEPREATKCHCKSGYYGSYNTITKDLQECKMCPIGSTSIPGTHSILGCYCDRGFARYSLDVEYVCKECSLVSGHGHYCSGAIEEDTKTTIDENSHTLVSRSVLLNLLTRPCSVCACAPNTKTKSMFAYTESHCIPEKHMFWDAVNKTAEYCDTSEYNSSDITIFEDSGAYCDRTCVSPSAIKTDNNDCRCNTDQGYVLDTGTKKCVCAAGWYLQPGDQYCVQCPIGSYCANGVNMVLCLPDMISPVHSTHRDNCTCMPGNYRWTSSSSTEYSHCVQCLVGYKCDGISHKLCTASVESCKYTGTFIPEVCAPGFMRNQVDKCIRMFNWIDFLPINHLILETKTQTKLYNPKITTILNNSFVEDRNALYVVLASEIPWPENHTLAVRKEKISTYNYLDPLYKIFYFLNINTMDNQKNIYVTYRRPAILGRNGFIDKTSLLVSDDLIHADNHLLWLYILSCNKESTRQENKDHVFSEVERCIACDTLSGRYTGLYETGQLRHSIAPVVIFRKSLYQPLSPSAQMYWTKGDIKEHNSMFLCITQYTDEGSTLQEFVRVDVFDRTTMYMSATHTFRALEFGVMEFILHLPVWKFKSASYPCILIGTCDYEHKDSIILHFYEVESNQMYTSEIQCADCCVFSNTRVITSDFFSLHNTLVLVVNNVIHEINITSDFYHENQLAYVPGGESTVQTVITNMPEDATVIMMDEWHQIGTEKYTLVLASHNMGSFGVISSNAGTYTYEEYVSHSSMIQSISGHTLHHIHHTASLLTPELSTVPLSDVSVLTRRGHAMMTEIPRKLDIAVLVKIPNILSSVTNVVLLTRLDDAGEIYETSIMTSFIESVEYNVEKLWYYLVPQFQHAGAENILYVTGSVGILMESHQTSLIREYIFKCMGCGENEVYNVETGACQCVQGSFFLCTECLTNTCSRNHKIIQAQERQCIVQNLVNAPETQNTLYSTSCVSCSGGFFCPSGENRDISLCPLTKPYSVKSKSSHIYDCVCGPGKTTNANTIFKQNVLEQKQSMRLAIDRFNVVELCQPCPANYVCNTFYSTQLKKLQCPTNTEYTVSVEELQLSSIVKQTCMCVSGFYKTSEETIDSFLIENILPSDIYSISDILLPKMGIFMSLTFELDNMLKIPVGFFEFDTLENAIEDWILFICGEANCLADKAHAPVVQQISCYTDDNVGPAIIENAGSKDICGNNASYTVNVSFHLATSNFIYDLRVSSSPRQYATFLSFLTQRNINYVVPQSLTFQSTDDTSLKTSISADKMFSRRQTIVKTQTCAACPPDYYCALGVKYQCPSNSISHPKSSNESQCLCIPGYTGKGCESCLPHTLCYGASKNVHCSTEETSAVKDANCPCDFGFFRDRRTRICTECPEGFLCEYNGTTTGVDPAYLQVPTRCPMKSSSIAGSWHIQHCLCAAGTTMNISARTCVLCSENMFCQGDTRAPVQCPAGTVSEQGAKSLKDCECLQSNMITILRDERIECVCNASYLLDTRHGSCVRCQNYPTETTVVPGGFCVCANGYFKKTNANLNTFAMHNLTDTNSMTHPFSSLHRRSMYLYLLEYPELLVENLGEYLAHGDSKCILCPPGFFCVGGQETNLHYVQSNVSQYTPFVVGAHTPSVWVYMYVVFTNTY